MCIRDSHCVVFTLLYVCLAKSLTTMFVWFSCDLGFCFSATCSCTYNSNDGISNTLRLFILSHYSSRKEQATRSSHVHQLCRQSRAQHPAGFLLLRLQTERGNSWCKASWQKYKSHPLALLKAVVFKCCCHTEVVDIVMTCCFFVNWAGMRCIKKRCGVEPLSF